LIRHSEKTAQMRTFAVQNPTMKSFLFVGLSAILSMNAMAQREMGTTHIVRTDILNDLFGSEGREVSDTLQPVLLDGCNALPMLIESSNGGYISGGNGYGDVEKAQFISTADSGTVFSVLALIAGKQGGINEEFRAFMYGGSLTTAPLGLPLDTSGPVTYDNIDTTGLFTTFTFINPTNFIGGFFLSLEVENNGAFIGIAHTDDNCGGNSAWERWNSGSWFPMNSTESWGIDISLYLYAEVSALFLSIDNTNLILRGSEKVVPNPVNSEAILMYSLIKSSDISVQIYSVSGKLIDSYKPGYQPSGLNQLALNTSALNPGMYIYSIATEMGVRNGKFSVVR